MEQLGSHWPDIHENLYSGIFRKSVAKKKHSVYDMIYLLTAIGLSPGGSSTAHIYTQTIHKR